MFIVTLLNRRDKSCRTRLNVEEILAAWVEAEQTETESLDRIALEDSDWRKTA